MVAGKMVLALTPKPERYTEHERIAVAQFNEYQQLKAQLAGLSPAQAVMRS